MVGSVLDAGAGLPLLLLLPPLLLTALIVAARLHRFMSQPRAQRDAHSLSIGFLHPDLGIGGAERLIVDSAVAAQRLGHSVIVYTAHHDRSRCFEETRDGTLRVAIAGGYLPRAVFGRFVIVCAALRAVAGALAMVFSAPELQVAVVDQVSLSVPLLRACGLRVLFYCHYPDKLLAPRPAAAVRRLLRMAYRLPFDLLEELSTGCAHVVLVNSKFTADVYAENFLLLRVLRVAMNALPPGVLHPSVDVVANPPLPWPRPTAGSQILLLSLNRFEGKKGHRLALEALRCLRASRPELAALVRLVVAGGYDPRLAENVRCFDELQAIAAEGGIGDAVEFRQNVSNQERRQLLQQAVVVVYTPSFEHFGIVPLEAMAAARPVIAVNNGGPLESVVDGATGWLRDPNPSAFASAFERVALVARDEPQKLQEMGEAARRHVEMSFSREAFGVKLDAHLRGKTRKSGQ